MCYNSTVSNCGWLSVVSRLSSLHIYLLQQSSQPVLCLRRRAGMCGWQPNLTLRSASLLQEMSVHALGVWERSYSTVSLWGLDIVPEPGGVRKR